MQRATITMVFAWTLAGCGSDDLESLPDNEPQTLQAIVDSATLRRVLIGPDVLALRAQELHDSGQLGAAIAHLDAAIEQAPTVQVFDQIRADWHAQAQ